jgi:hypothetical protein
MTEATQTYTLFYLQDGEPVIFYVGEAIDPAARFKRHQRDAADPLNEKEAYAYLREHGVTEFFYEVVPDITEAELVRELTLAGVRLYNSNGGIRSATKKRRDTVFAAINAEAHERLERSERRTLLHNAAQTYSKSQTVAQRIRGDVPSVTQMLDAEWRPCPPEMLSSTVARTAQAAEYARFGDVSVYVATRRKDTCVVARNTRTSKECTLPKPLWWGAPRERLFAILHEHMVVDHYWERPYVG